MNISILMQALTGNNVVLQGKPTQSSLYGFGFAYNAIDGNHNGILEDGSSSCTHTKVNFNPHKGFSITITNRMDGTFSRLNGSEFRIGDSLKTTRTMATTIPAGFSSTFQCNGMEGRHINVVIAGRSEHLILCEVEVYGSPLD
ncbi:unnamed protein product [Coregonus sp. 'balchen']|nr:unnamed protein product [Coregonus sp. 'balchen']